MFFDDGLWQETAILSHQRTSPAGDPMPAERLSKRPLSDIVVLLSLMDDHKGMHVDLEHRLTRPFGFTGAAIAKLLKAHRERKPSGSNR